MQFASQRDWSIRDTNSLVLPAKTQREKVKLRCRMLGPTETHMHEICAAQRNQNSFTHEFAQINEHFFWFAKCIIIFCEFVFFSPRF